MRSCTREIHVEELSSGTYHSLSGIPEGLERHEIVRVVVPGKTRCNYYSASVIDVDQEKDLYWLHVDKSFAQWH